MILRVWEAILHSVGWHGSRIGDLGSLELRVGIELTTVHRRYLRGRAVYRS